jgi:hypothetical protein
MQGSPISSITVGQQFQIQQWISDTSINPSGVFSSYHQLHFTAGRVETDVAVAFGSIVGALTAGEVAPGIIKMGAIVNDTPVGGIEQLFSTTTFTALEAGQFTASAVDGGGPNQELLEFLSDDPIPVGNIDFGSLNLNILPIPMSYTATSTSTLRVLAEGGYVKVRDTTIPGSPQVVASQLAVNTSVIQVTGSSGSDWFYIEPSALAVGVPIHVAGGNGGDLMFIYDSGNTQPATVWLDDDSVVFGPTTITMSSIGSMNLVLGSGVNTVHVAAVPADTNIVAQPNDSVLITGVQAGLELSVDLTSAGSGGHVSIGHDGDLDGILGEVAVEASNRGLLDILDDETGGGQTYQFSSVAGGFTQLTRAGLSGTIKYKGLNSVYFESGAGGHTINLGTVGGAGTATTLGTGNLQIRGGTGTNTYNINTTGTGDLWVNQPTNNANSTFNVRGTTSGQTVLDGGEGNDVYNIGAGSNSLSNINGLLYVTGKAGVSVLNISDSSYATAATYNFSNPASGVTGFSRGGMSGSIAYTSMNNVYMGIGTGNSTINLGDLYGAAMFLNAGTMTVNGGEHANDTLNVNLTGSGNLIANGRSAITGGSNCNIRGTTTGTTTLDGGEGNDVFTIGAPNHSVAGIYGNIIVNGDSEEGNMSYLTIDDSAGSDTLSVGSNGTSIVDANGHFTISFGGVRLVVKYINNGQAPVYIYL